MSQSMMYQSMINLRFKGVWADSASRSAEIEAALAARNLTSHIHRRGNRNKPLTKRQEAANKVPSKVRARVEHVLGNQHNSMAASSSAPSASCAPA